MSFIDSVRRAPCVPMMMLSVAGIVLDRYGIVANYVWPILIGIGLAAWFTWRNWLAAGLAVAGLAGLQHHQHCFSFSKDDIGQFATDEPKLVQLRGRIVESPSIDVPARTDPLRSIPESARTFFVLDSMQLVNGSGEHGVSGRVSATLIGAKSALHVDDELQLTGWLARPRAPDNPGERDRAIEARDQRIRATFLVRNLGDPSIGLIANSRWTWQQSLSRIRNWAELTIGDQLPANVSGLAAALLLGDTSAMARQQWEKYIRTGVVHVLAVSGQHLSILAGFAWIVFRIVGVRRRHAAIIVALGIAIYAGLVGWRPPVTRATVMVLVTCSAMWLGRPAFPGNMMALSLLVVLFLNPTDLFDPGCQFSFVCMAILIWSLPKWLPRETDPLTQIEEQLYSPWKRGLREAGRLVIRSYIATAIFIVALAPLTAERYHLLTPVGILIGPPAILLASIALLSGFALLIAAAVFPIAANFFVPIVSGSLMSLSAMVDLADRIPCGSFYVGRIELWWVVGFYIQLAVALWPPPRFHHRWCVITGLTWVIFGFILSFHRSSPDGMRVTFLSVGHGGATVAEMPDGRVILYDCGSMSGPDVTRRIVAPFLWHRGIHHIDELIITHADLDHFNGVPALMQRFHVGRVSITPSFAAKPTPGVSVLLDDLQRRNTEIVIRAAGDRMSAGNVNFEVWHPPAVGPPGPENARSLVMAIHHEGHRIVLTGDLDLEGRPMVMSRSRESIDVWLAPHHGGRTANPIEMAAWAKPRISIAHNATGESQAAQENYEQIGSRFIGTWPHGAITVISRKGEIVVETFRSRQIFQLQD